MLAIKTLVSNNLTIYRHSAMLMGNRFEISVVADNPGWAKQRINDAIAEINRVEKLLSAFGDDSCVNEINRNAGIKAVKVAPELFRLIDRALQLSDLTAGGFDITYTHADKSIANYKNVVLDAAAQTVFLKQEGMRISFASNSKGYAADRAKYILQMQGVNSGVINAGGDLLTWGSQPDTTAWTVGTADPDQQKQAYALLDISNMAFATSINNNKCAAINNKVAGAIHPKNGFEVSAIQSVSILCPTAEMAGAMANPVLSSGVNAGLYMVNQLNQIACVIIDDSQRVYTSKHITIG